MTPSDRDSQNSLHTGDHKLRRTEDPTKHTTWSPLFVPIYHRAQWSCKSRPSPRRSRISRGITITSEEQVILGRKNNNHSRTATANFWCNFCFPCFGQELLVQCISIFLASHSLFSNPNGAVEDSVPADLSVLNCCVWFPRSKWCSICPELRSVVL